MMNFVTNFQSIERDETEFSVKGAFFVAACVGLVIFPPVHLPLKTVNNDDVKSLMRRKCTSSDLPPCAQYIHAR